LLQFKEGVFSMFIFNKIKIKLPSFFFCLTVVFLLLFVGPVGVIKVVAKEVVGRSSYEYSKDFRHYKSNKKKIMEKARTLACLNAIDNYVNSLSTSKTTAFAKIRPDVEANISKYADCGAILDSEHHKGQKRFTIALRANIFENKIEQLFIATSGVSSTSGHSVAIIFVTRQFDSSSKKSFDDRKVKQNKRTDFEESSEVEAVSESETTVSSKTTKSNRSETGGSTVKRVTSTKVKYKVATFGAEAIVNSGFSAVLTEYGFTLEKLSDFDPYQDRDVRALAKEWKELYVTTGEPDLGIESEIKSYFKSMKNTEWPVKYVVIGVFDVGQEEKDPNTGEVVVNSSLTSAEIFDCFKGRKCASIGAVTPDQKKGRGTEAPQAQKNSLKLIVDYVAREAAIKFR
jgi:hypothetical protein